MNTKPILPIAVPSLFLQYILHFFLRIALLTYLIFVYTGCNRGQDQSNSLDDQTGYYERTKQQLKNVTDAIKDKVHPYKEPINKTADAAGKLADNEYKKLIKVEYKVIEFPRYANGLEIESLLKKHGEDRWDCFYIEQATDVNRVYCKRYPLHYLKLLPYLF
jgi:hypothetical protein